MRTEFLRSIMVWNRSSNRVKLVAVSVFFLVVLKLLLVFVNVPNEYFSQKIKHEHLSEAPCGMSNNFDTYTDEETEIEITDKMKEVIHELRDQIETETRGYKFPPYRDLKDLIPERKGTPMRSLIITSWRSGSTFIGEVINSHPAMFYLSEPLSDYGYKQVRREALAFSAVQVLRKLIMCNYNGLGRYLLHNNRHSWTAPYNTRLWQHCSINKSICDLPQFLEPACKLFPFLSMKVIRMRLRLVEELLLDTKLNVRVVLLVRDPRGVMESRSALDWCQSHEDCASPANLCADLVDDYSAALRFTKLFPDKFKVVRYEDMSLRATVVIPELFRFFGLQYHIDVQRFVKSHISKTDSDIYSTYRNSSVTALQWRTRTKYSRVKELQETCRVALFAWGYLPAHNASHQLVFNPLVEQFYLN